MTEDSALISNHNVTYSGVLNGWKEIANHLHKSVRTVQRCERTSGLPVHRPGGKSAGSVIATPTELDAWAASRPIRAFLALDSSNRASSALIKELRSNVTELRRLREETAESRQGLAESRHTLIGTLAHIRSLQLEMVETLTEFWKRHPDPLAL